MLANAAFGRSPVQQQVSDGGGVELLLEQCQVHVISAQAACCFAGTACCMAERAVSELLLMMTRD